MIMVSVTVALIMVIIGSEIARAFALVGAMSIIRFRNPRSKDVAFLFVTIAIGMAWCWLLHVCDGVYCRNYYPHASYALL